MKLWRISEFLALDGEGARLFEGRWNRGGRALVYTAESSALAILEVLVQYRRSALPGPSRIIEVGVPEDAEVRIYPGSVPPTDKTISQAWGEDWLTSGATLLAQVPAAVAPESSNILINPAHPHARDVKVTRHWQHEWDRRLFL